MPEGAFTAADLQRIQAACVHVVTEYDGGVEHSVGFYVGEDRIVVCHHGLYPEGSTGKPQRVSLISVAGQEGWADPEKARSDPQNDTAVLFLESGGAMKLQLEPLQLAQHRGEVDSRFYIYGLPKAYAKRGEAGSWGEEAGKVLNPSGKDDDERDSIVLRCDGGDFPQGYSGGPVVIKQGGGLLVIGNVKRFINHPIISGQSIDKKLFACPAEYCRRLLGEEIAAPAPRPLPGGPFDRGLYVARDREQTIALRHIRAPAGMASICGPPGSGKTWMHEWLCEELRQDEGVLLVKIDLAECLCGTLEDVFLALAQRVAAAVKAPDHLVPDFWQRQKTDPKFRLTRFLERHILSESVPEGRCLVLAIENGDVLYDRPYGEEFFVYLRSWKNRIEPPWPSLRLLLTCSTNPILTQTECRVPFNHINPILLPDLDTPQIRSLAKSYGLAWDDAELTALKDHFGGHPLLLCLALASTLEGLQTAEEVIRRCLDMHGIQNHLSQVHDLIIKRKDLMDELCRLLALNGKVGKLDDEPGRRLSMAGVVVRQSSGYRIRCRLYGDFFSGLCRARNG